MPLAQAFDERKALLLYGKDALLDGGTIGVLSLFDHRDCIVRIADLGLARCIVWNLLAAELIGAGTLAVSLEVCSWGDVGPLDVGALVQLSQRLRDIGYQRLEGVWEVRAVCELFGQCAIHIETAGVADNDKVDIGTRKDICKVLEGDLVLRQGLGVLSPKAPTITSKPLRSSVVRSKRSFCGACCACVLLSRRTSAVTSCPRLTDVQSSRFAVRYYNCVACPLSVCCALLS